MAIYTQYGRYLKAKLFKKSLEQDHDTYMVLGLGNPEWDSDPSQDMTQAPYDASIIADTSQSPNPFEDDSIIQNVLSYTTNTDPDTYNNTAIYSNNEFTGNTLEKAEKNLLPLFPCTWRSSGGNTDILSYKITDDGTYTLKQADLSICYIVYDDTSESYKLYKIVGTTSTELGSVDFDTLTPKEKQYFAELYLRGLALNISNEICTDNRTMPGLLGAVKCSIDYVKDIGFNETNYTGASNQLWYGDRYWEIVNPDDDSLNNYISIDDSGTKNKIYPHHLLISATISPLMLCSDINVDQNIVPRQIAICTKNKSSDANAISYKVGDYIFNFGQYNDHDIAESLKGPTVEYSTGYVSCSTITDTTSEPCSIYGYVYSKVHLSADPLGNLYATFTICDDLQNVTKTIKINSAIVDTSSTESTSESTSESESESTDNHTNNTSIYNIHEGDYIELVCDSIVKEADTYRTSGTVTITRVVNLDKGKVLNFALPCILGLNDAWPNGNYGSVEDATSSAHENDFRILMHDYIKGNPRVLHQVDRIGYIIGF